MEEGRNKRSEEDRKNKRERRKEERRNEGRNGGRKEVRKEEGIMRNHPFFLCAYIRIM